MGHSGVEGWPLGGERDWCLFLDRDGVINRRIVGDYVRTWEQFSFEPGSLAALRTLSHWAPYVVVVTNQQGVGRGLMTTAELADIHDRMTREVSAAGGRIDEVLTCEHLACEDCACRKPRTGMVDPWLARHPEVEVARSVVVGDAPSDMQLAGTLGVGKRVWIGEEPPADGSAGAAFRSLAALADFVESRLLKEEP